ncbi:MAG: mechanosensitive ion channel family protein [Opitutaceae bacterium]
MTHFWKSILTSWPRLLKWLVFILLASIVVAGATGRLEVVQTQLDREALSYTIGDVTITAFDLIRTFLIVIFAFWMASILSAILGYRINKMERIRSSNRLLLQKIAQIVIYLICFLLTLDMLGIDLTTLTVFGGAIGIGLGFGLQKITSNFVSGLILLLEKSIELGDLVQLGDQVSGYIRKSGARFTLVETFDGKEIMVPNEDFITNRVTNWTYSNTRGRVEIPVGVAYGSDLDKVRDILIEAATEHSACLDEPAPNCYLREFGDSSVNFILHFWLADVTSGRWGPQSEVMLSVWRKFKTHEIEIPFPQRDVHIKGALTEATKDKG